MGEIETTIDAKIREFVLMLPFLKFKYATINTRKDLPKIVIKGTCIKQQQTCSYLYMKLKIEMKDGYLVMEKIVTSQNY